MSASTILDTLHSIPKEPVFRDPVLMGLLEKMNLLPTFTHGQREKGKDIVCREINEFGNEEFVAVVAKVGRITATAGKTGGLGDIVNQVVDSFGCPYPDPRSKEEKWISKVLVITNEVITVEAQERIVRSARLSRPMKTNTHFLEGRDLARLIEKHWPDFMAAADTFLTQHDYMTDDSGLVLYVLSVAHIRSVTTKRKRGKTELTREMLQEQSGLSRTDVAAALPYLLTQKYVEERRGVTVRLHPRETVGRILTNPRHVQILFSIEELANSQLHFTEDAILKRCKRAGFAERFVRNALKAMKSGEYIYPDTSRNKPGHYLLHPHTIHDERPYLSCCERYGGQLPAARKGSAVSLQRQQKTSKRVR